MSTPEGTEFVPMIQNRSDLSVKALKTAKSNGKVLLGFNEPELRAHANMTVHEVLEAWPLLQKTGMRLGSPAVAGDADRVGSYFYEFMAGVKERGYRVDFVAVHWYLAPWLRNEFSVAHAVDDLKSYLERVHKRYRLPVWLTEFSLVTWYQTTQHVQPRAVQAEFLKEASAMMRSLDFLERWAWFSLNPSPSAPRTALYNANGRITPAGREFRKVS